MLDPAGPFAAPVTLLSWVLLLMFAVVLAVVLVALWIALFAPDEVKRRFGGERLIWAGGIAFPVVVLTALLVWGLSLTSRLTDAPTGDELRIRVSGEMWWWRVSYLDPQGREIAWDANEVHIPAGRPVVFELTSADVVHSFWVPRLSGKLDMIPGRTNILRLQADAPGAYGGQCAEYCGGPHALMGLVVVAHEPAAFEAQLARLRTPAQSPATAEAAFGAEVFLNSGCGACHVVRGTEANGLAGPDLTHVGSRRTLGAGILPNNRGTLGGWVSNTQDIKPGARMPAYQNLSGEELLAVTAYLEGLK
ncbi:MAG: c-type cytochrome [Brevundimonas sp.]